MSAAVATVGGTSRLLSNTAWNVGGQLLPLVVAVLALPLLIDLLGLERFGFISLVWVLVGYASVFDFGIGRAVIRTVAAHLGAGDRPRAARSAHAGLLYLTVFGLLLGIALVPAGAWLVQSAVKLPAELVSEAVPAVWLLAASLPFVMVTTGFGGVLSAHQRFKALNLVRMVTGVASYVAQVLVALWLPRLEAVVAVVLLLRVVGTLAHAWICAAQCGWRPQWAWPGREASRELFTLGGWMAVSNILSPMLSYLDRLLLATLVPVRMVAVYAAPYDVLIRAMILPSSIMASVFPRASSLARGTGSAQQLLRDTTRLLHVAMFPLIFVVVAFAQPALRTWLPQIAEPGAIVMQILALGMLLNALAQSPATLIQAAGEPRWMAQLHLVELPLFVGLLWLLTAHWGVIGTAIASLLRNGLDAVAVYWIARRHVAPGPWPWRNALAPSLLAGLMLICACWPQTWLQSLLVAVPGLALWATHTWLRLLRPDERAQLRALATKTLRPGPPTRA